ncbi:MAG: ImmA/IrrE family metallo-endopeptidase [Actinomycetota bacterium]|nr:ImmA/IrrE family metallo-endopeptidase [Actinomycetota bacterium]
MAVHQVRQRGSRGSAAPYDPWRDLCENWPGIQVIEEAMSGRLLGELRYPVIALRAGTTAAQRRCTLTHEIVHLERGLRDCGPWADREERQVHAEVARRLIRTEGLARAVRNLGGTDDAGALAQALDVDLETLRVRLALLSGAERAYIASASVRELWSVA